MSDKVVNQAGQVIGTVVKGAEIVDPALTAVVTDTKAVVTKVHEYAVDNALGVNTRSVEKLLVYGAGLVGATNGFAQLAMPNTLRAALIAVSGFVIASMHVTSKNS